MRVLRTRATGRQDLDGVRRLLRWRERAQSNSRHRAGSGPARGTEPTTSTERAAGRRVVCASLRTSLTDYSRGSAPVTSTSNCGTARHGTARHGGAAGARGTRSPRRTAECCASGLEPRASRREHQLGRLEAHSADDRAWPGSSTPGWMQADRRRGRCRTRRGARRPRGQRASCAVAGSVLPQRAVGCCAGAGAGASRVAAACTRSVIAACDGEFGCVVAITSCWPCSVRRVC